MISLRLPFIKLLSLTLAPTSRFTDRCKLNSNQLQMRKDYKPNPTNSAENKPLFIKMHSRLPKNFDMLEPTTKVTRNFDIAISFEVSHISSKRKKTIFNSLYIPPQNHLKTISHKLFRAIVRYSGSF